MSRKINPSDEYFPNKIIKKKNYQSYIIRQKPDIFNLFFNNLSSDKVRKTFKTLNETQKFNKSGIVKESFNHILYQNKNWTEKKKYPVIEIKKEQPLTPFKALKSVEKIKNIKKVKKMPIKLKKKELSPNIIRKRELGKKKKKIIIKICDDDENNVNEYDNKKYFKGIKLTENKDMVEEKFAKKINKREKLFDREDKKASSVNKIKRYRKIPIKICFD
jgi:hypothetical protein